MSENSDMLTLNDYQDATEDTAIYPGQGGLLGLNYAALEAAGEAGEIANKVKKIMRDSYGDLLRSASENREDSGDALELLLGWQSPAKGYLGEDQRIAIMKEVGGALYGLARVASELGVTLGEIAQQNLEVLASRQVRGTLTGSGDER